MAEVAKVHAERLEELKKYVEDWRQYFNDNILRYEKFMRFVFKTSMTNEECSALKDIGKPTIEFNMCEPYISRLRGEFAKQQPSLTVRAADGAPSTMITPDFLDTIDLIEAHLRTILFDGCNDMLSYNIYSDQLGGGFSGLKVYTDYINEKSFEQNIYCEKVYDPTLMVFDILAKESHKGDGRFAGQLFPMSKEAFKEEFGEEALEGIKFSRNVAGFSWSFKNEVEEVILVCEFFEKKLKKETIYQLSTYEVKTKKEYDKMIEDWEKDGRIEQPPVILSERKTQIETIVRYRFCESRMLDYVETDYKMLPIVFVDGNSVFLRENGSYQQVTRPYVYHIEGIQKLLNFSGQSLANEIENTVAHKIIAAIESIPPDYTDAYTNLQKPRTLVYTHKDPKVPGATLPPPREIMRTPIPPEIPNTFRTAPEMMQYILGNYDASQGITNSAMSGIALMQGAIQSNNAATPYNVSYVKALNRVAQIFVDLIPKYYRTPRTLPIILPNGKKSFYEINQKGSLYMNFDPSTLQVKVEAGVNYAIQKELSLKTVTSLCQTNQAFAQFFNEEGLPILLDNIEIRGIDQLKAKADEWMKKQKETQQQQQQMEQQQQVQQMQQQAQEAQMQQQEQQMKLAMMQKDLQSPSEGQIGAMLVQQKAQNDAANTAIKARDSETKYIETLSKVQTAGIDQQLKAAQITAEHERTAVDSAIKLSQHITEVTNKSMEQHHETQKAENVDSES